MSRLHLTLASALAVLCMACTRTAGDLIATRPVIPVATPITTPTPQPAAATAAARPIVVPSAVPTAPGRTESFKVFFVALNDKGARGKKIGCDDSLVPVTLATGLSEKPIAAALNQLFAVKTTSYQQSGLYTALYQSSVQVESTDVDASGKVLVKLKGNIPLGGVCDAPRAVEQIRETVTQFSWSKNAVITINGQPLDSIGAAR
jgi:hypothetical protein